LKELYLVAVIRHVFYCLSEAIYSVCRQLLLAKDLETVLALSSVSAGSNDRGPLATALLQIFRHEHQEAHLLRTLNDLVIDNEGESFGFVNLKICSFDVTACMKC